MKVVFSEDGETLLVMGTGIIFRVDGTGNQCFIIAKHWGSDEVVVMTGYYPREDIQQGLFALSECLSWTAEEDSYYVIRMSEIFSSPSQEAK